MSCGLVFLFCFILEGFVTFPSLRSIPHKEPLWNHKIHCQHLPRPGRCRDEDRSSETRSVRHKSTGEDTIPLFLGRRTPTTLIIYSDADNLQLVLRPVLFTIEDISFQVLFLSFDREDVRFSHCYFVFYSN